MEGQSTGLKIYTRMEYEEKAERWADELSIPLISVGNNTLPETLSEEIPEGSGGIPDLELHLWVDEQGLSLRQGDLSLRGDFTRLSSRLRKNNLLREFLVKGCHIKGNPHPVVLDATAGLGEDSMILASAGFEVHLFEYNPVIGALLMDAMERGMSDPALAEGIGRMKAYIGDSRKGMEDPEKYLGKVPDVILLDPMFPERQKSALVKKKFQLLQQLEAPCSQEEELLQSALRSGAQKILIKRPLKGPILAGKKPSYSLQGKAIRYDCIVLPK